MNTFKSYRNRFLITADLLVIPKDDKWHHLVVTKTPVEELVYVDGKKIPYGLLEWNKPKTI
jgi:hypothetical protein